MSTAKKRKPAVKQQPAKLAPAPDPRFANLVASLALDPVFAAIVTEYHSAKMTGGRKFGSNGLKINGKLFTFASQGGLVVKLPKERVEALVTAGKGEFFNPGHGRLMKEWILIKGTEQEWVALAKEAYQFVHSVIK